MKHIVLVILVALFGVTAKAQYTSAVGVLSGTKWGPKTMQYYTSGDDTATNTDIIRMGAIMNDKYDVNIKLTYTKVSGTVDGWIYVRSSPDGTNWVTISEGETKSYKDSVDIADATTTIVLSYTADEINGKYIEVVYSQSGTAVSAPVATLYYRKSED
jgi:hypothetical protein